MSLKLVHNGYKIQFYNTQQEVDEYIQNVLNNYKELNPKKVLDIKTDDYDIISYRYHTLYEETFIIYKEEN